MHRINSAGKCFTKKELIYANNAAISEDRNRQLNEDYLDSLPDDGVFPICLAFDEHNRGEIRVQIIFDEAGTTGFLDLTKNRYNLLPTAIVNKDGRVELKYTGKKPYPDDRPYVEKVSRKLVRDSSFSKRVLTAYGNQCAMCEITDTSLLVGAHIYPAHLCGDDTVNNGICLCSNHDKAYERGLICVNPDGEIIIYSKSIESSFLRIRLPRDKKDHPSPERLRQRLELSISKRRS